MKKSMGWMKVIALPLLLITLSMTTWSCRQGDRGADQLAQSSSAAQNPDSNLTFNNITLEQPDEKGQTLWKVKAKQAIYSPDKKTAKVQSPYGQFYQDGKLIYRIQAQQGEVQRNGDRIYMRGEVVATDVENGAVLRGNELEWRPKQDLLIVRGNLRGTHPKLLMSANEGRMLHRQGRMELSGNVEAITQEEPQLRVQGQKVVWLMKQEKIVSDLPVQVQRLQNKTQVTDQANGDSAEVQLTDRIAHLKKNARVTLLEPPLLVTGNSLIWNLKKDTLIADQPVTVVHREQQVTLTAERGQFELKPKVARFSGNVRAIGQKNQSNLASDNLVWTIPTKLLEAEGNVVYNQADPPATLRGPRAIGKLENQTVVVSGGRVVTEIVPE